MKNIKFKSTNQEGAVLVIALILLVILTMLGISAVESTKLETRMAANTEEYNRTFQLAEAGLIDIVNYYTKNSAELLELPLNKFVSLDANTYSGAKGICEFCILRSGTTVDEGSTDSFRNFIVEVTAFNDIDADASSDDKANALQVKLVVGIITKRRKKAGDLETGGYVTEE